MGLGVRLYCYGSRLQCFQDYLRVVFVGILIEIEQWQVMFKGGLFCLFVRRQQGFSFYGVLERGWVDGCLLQMGFFQRINVVRGKRFQILWGLYVQQVFGDVWVWVFVLFCWFLSICSRSRIFVEFLQFGFLECIGFGF